MFSDKSLTWENALAECKLYGGWLVNINDQLGKNSLIRHGRMKNPLHGTGLMVEDKKS